MRSCLPACWCDPAQPLVRSLPSPLALTGGRKASPGCTAVGRPQGAGEEACIVAQGAWTRALALEVLAGPVGNAHSHVSAHHAYPHRVGAQLLGHARV